MPNENSDNGAAHANQNSAHGPQIIALYGVVVEDEDVDILQGLDERIPLALDPEVHGVAHHELGAAELPHHFALQVRIDVGQEDVVPIT